MKSIDDHQVCAFGASALLGHLQSIQNEWEGVRQAQDIECIHRMRVATRRFRSVFEIFSTCLPKKKRGLWQTEISALTKSLSKARDLDVHIAILEDILQNIPSSQYRPGIHRILLRLRQLRTKLQPEVVASLDQLEKNGLIQEISTSLQKLTSDDDISPSPALYEIAFDAINRCMNDLLSYDGRIQNPKLVADLHAMRLAAKNLRYTMEIFQNLYTNRLEDQLAVVKEIQTQLGDIHDDDIWLVKLDKFLITEHKRTLKYFGHTRPFNLLQPGIHFFQEDRRQNRSRLYQEFIPKWEKWKTENIWGSLYQATKLPTIIYHPDPEPLVDDQKTPIIAPVETDDFDTRQTWQTDPPADEGSPIETV